MKFGFFAGMSVEVCSINSGSNGNCYYVGNEKEAVLVDAGISCREIEKRMKRTSLDIQKVKAIFISHEHSDHIRGLSVFARKHQLPVYITTPTLSSGGISLNPSQVKTFRAYEPLRIGSLTVTPFPKLHDACDPYSFTISSGDIRVGVFTDIGFPCSHLIRQFSQCHAAFLESNYDHGMLENGNYPYHLKRRIRGGKGHLSNEQAFALFRHHRPSYMSHLILSHLSAHNNDPALVEQLFNSYPCETRIVVASRYQESEIFRIGVGEVVKECVPVVTQTQLSFSFL